MKILIAYYSKWGSTEELALAIKEELEKRGHDVVIEKIKPVKERSFLLWFLMRCFIWETDIVPPRFRDISSFDRICIGSPNWTAVSLPVARYLKKVKGLENKKVGIFYTSCGFPQEQYFEFYLPYGTFIYRIKKQGGKVIAKLFLSSLLFPWKITSKYGQKAIKEFCNKIEK